MAQDHADNYKGPKEMARLKAKASFASSHQGLSKKEWDALQKAEKLAQTRAKYLLSLGNPPELVELLTGVKTKD
jgi:hypothetical protein